MPPEAAAERLRAVTRTPRGFLDSLARRPVGADYPFQFVGKVEGDRFKLRREIGANSYNSFLPVIRGRIDSSGGPTRVNVRMFLHPLVCMFMLFGLGVLGMAIVEDALERRASFPLIGFFLFGLGLLIVGFFPEAHLARRLITSAVLGEDSLKPPH